MEIGGAVAQETLDIDRSTDTSGTPSASGPFEEVIMRKTRYGGRDSRRSRFTITKLWGDGQKLARARGRMLEHKS